MLSECTGGKKIGLDDLEMIFGFPLKWFLGAWEAKKCTDFKLMESILKQYHKAVLKFSKVKLSHDF